MTDPAPLKHETIAAELAREIRAGRMMRGRRLPGETTLAERFDVSRNTVRQALLELNRAGLIHTRTGKGSFVTYDGAVLDSPKGWAVGLEERGVTTLVDELRMELVVDAEFAASVGADIDEFIAIDRVRRIAGGKSISYERSRVPAIGALRDIPTRGLIAGSITATLIEAGMIGDRGEQTVSARPLTAEEARILGRPQTDWFLQSLRVTRALAGDFIEHVESALDPIHFQLRWQFE